MEQIDGEYFKNLVSQMRDTGYPQEIDRVQISIPNAEKRLRGGLQYVVNMKSGCNAEWNERNYRPIVDWMTDNKGKGLLMFGGCGLGKSVIGTYILPLLIKDVHKKVVNIFSAQEFSKWHTLVAIRVKIILCTNIINIDNMKFENFINLLVQLLCAKDVYHLFMYIFNKKRKDIHSDYRLA